MERFKEFSEETKKIFYEAIETNDLETVLMFLEAGVDINNQHPFGLTPLHHVVELNRPEMVELLLAAGADPNGKDWEGTPLYYLYKDNPEIAIMLLAAGADPNVKNMWDEPVLNSYILRRQLKVVKVLLLAGANTNVKNYKGKSSLYYAKKYATTEMVRLLLDYGAK